MTKSIIDKVIDNIVDGIYDNFFGDEWVGKFGEMLTAGELQFVKFFGRKGRILRNVYLPKDNGETSELDVVFITQKGIFVFESKNFSGWIFGDEKSKNWMATLSNGIKNQFYNPVMQNKTHLKWMKNFVGEDIPLFSIIVFSERCELKKITMHSEDVKVIKRDWTYATVREIWDKSPDAVSDEKVKELYGKLKKLTKVSADVKAAHVENIEKKYKNPAEPKMEVSVKAENIDITNLEQTDNTIQKTEIPVAENTLQSSPVKEQTQVIEPAVASTEKNTFIERICPRCGSKLNAYYFLKISE